MKNIVKRCIFEKQRESHYTCLMVGGRLFQTDIVEKHRYKK